VKAQKVFLLARLLLCTLYWRIQHSKDSLDGFEVVALWQRNDMEMGRSKGEGRKGRG